MEKQRVDPRRTPSSKRSPQRRSSGPAWPSLTGTFIQRAKRAPASLQSSEWLRLQRTIGNRATTQVMGAAGGEVDDSLQRDIAAARGGGQALDSRVSAQIGHSLGTDFSGVKVHANAQSDALNRSLSASAFTLGRDIFFSRGAYQPNTNGGNKLLAHELTHVVQQGSAKSTKLQTKLRVGAAADAHEREADRIAEHVPLRGETASYSHGRHPEPRALTVLGRIPSNRISTKKVKMHLDFVRMKRKKAHIGKKIEETLGLGPGVRDPYGHWWTELGALNGSETWTPAESFGWWPSQKVTVKQTLKGVPGVLNKGGSADPHQGHHGDTEFHPVMTVDDQADYDQVRAQVSGKLRSFAKGFKGSWNWRFGWGKNCHSFQQRMKKALHLHNQVSKRWLRDPKALAEKHQLKQEAEAQQEQARQKELAARPEPSQWLSLPHFLGFYDMEGGVVSRQLGMLRPESKIGITGVTQGNSVQIVLAVGTKKTWHWADRREYENLLGPYPTAGQTESATSESPPDSAQTDVLDNDSAPDEVDLSTISPPQAEHPSTTHSPSHAPEVHGSQTAQGETQPAHTLKPKAVYSLHTPLHIVRRNGGVHTIAADKQIMVRELHGNTVVLDGSDSTVGEAPLADVLAAIVQN